MIVYQVIETKESFKAHHRIYGARRRSRIYFRKSDVSNKLKLNSHRTYRVFVYRLNQIDEFNGTAWESFKDHNWEHTNNDE